MEVINNMTDINSFLKLGYFNSYKNNTYQLNYSHIDRIKYFNWQEDDLIELSIALFRKGIEDEFNPNQDHVLPLSGGLDSRALLAGLLELTPAKNIHTYTFGTPGTFDYEIGNYIAARAGTEHINFPLTQYQYSLDELLDISRRVDNQTVLFHHPPVWELDKLFRGCQFWSGYIGDAITGGHLKSTVSQNIIEARRRYLRKYAFVFSAKLTNCQDEELIERIECPCLDQDILNLDEQILYQERVQKLTAPHVLMRGFLYKTPFINNDFMDLMLSVADSHRKGQSLYKKMLCKTYPFLFSLKTKNNYGLPLYANSILTFIKKAELKCKKMCNRVYHTFLDKRINYLDFDSAIRERSDLRSIFAENLMDLEKRGIIDWISINKIWNAHLMKQGYYSDALIVLVSLEIHLKAISN
jgi:asparagine synthetase B (glutamine-hydrolysing)